MQTNALETRIQKIQDNLYEGLSSEEFRNQNGCCARFAVIPLAIADVTLEIVKCAVGVVTQLALAALNLVGFLLCGCCSNKFSLEDAGSSFSRAFENAVLLVVSPLTFVFSVVGNLSEPFGSKSLGHLRDIRAGMPLQV